MKKILLLLCIVFFIQTISFGQLQQGTKFSVFVPASCSVDGQNPITVTPSEAAQLVEVRANANVDGAYDIILYASASYMGDSFTVEVNRNCGGVPDNQIIVYNDLIPHLEPNVFSTDRTCIGLNHLYNSDYNHSGYRNTTEIHWYVTLDNSVPTPSIGSEEFIGEDYSRLYELGNNERIFAFFYFKLETNDFFSNGVEFSANVEECLEEPLLNGSIYDIQFEAVCPEVDSSPKVVTPSYPTGESYPGTITFRMYDNSGLTGTPQEVTPGGSFDIPIDPDYSGTGSSVTYFIVTYNSYYDKESSPARATIQYDGYETIAINNIESEYNLFHPVVTLNFEPAEATISGPGITADNEFIPYEAGVTPEGQPHIITITFNNNGCTYDREYEVIVSEEGFCRTQLPGNVDGTLRLDNLTGQYVFDNNCHGEVILECVSNDANPLKNLGAIGAEAVTYSDDWSDDRLEYPEYGNDYELGKKGKWRPKSSYTYNSELSYADNRNYSDGTFEVSLFNYNSENSNTDWIKTSEVTMYSTNGEGLEEINPLGRYSAVKFGHSGSVPVLTAQNASYDQIWFQSFEETGNADNAHSGSKSLGISSSKYTSPELSANESYLMKFWVAKTKSANSYGFITNELAYKKVTGSTNVSLEPKVIAQVGTWYLIELRFETSSTGGDVIEISAVNGQQDYFLDDVRIQPVDSEMTCYVYEPGTLRLLTIFDEQHFGLYYQYNSEGKLVRKKIETERGLKTIQETQYNLKGVGSSGE